MGHWYSQDGKLFDNATLREARKFNLYPSVTTILQEKNNPTLEKWKIKQAIEKTKLNPELSTDEILKQYLEKSTNATDFGTTVHNLIERYLKKENINLNEYNDNIQNAVNNAINWIKDNVKIIVDAERTGICNEFGFAGTIDLIATLIDGSTAIIDFKTQESKNCNLSGYDSWAYQLAAYKIMCEESFKVNKCINIILASNLNLIKIIEYNNDQMYLSKIVFLALNDVFRYSRNFILEEQNEKYN